MTSSRLKTILATSTLLAASSLVASLALLSSQESSSTHAALLALCTSTFIISAALSIQCALVVFTYRSRTLPRHHITRRLSGTLVVGVLCCALIPANWLAHNHQRVVDLSAMRELSPGPGTQRVLSDLPGTIDATAFLEPHSDLKPVLDAYFAQLDGVTLTTLDQRSHPDEARRLSVRDNGVLVLEYLTTPDDHAPAIKRLDIGQSRQQSRQTVNNLDDTIAKQLRSLSSSRRTVYVLQGHGELSISGQGKRGPASFAQGQELLRTRLNLDVKPLGMFEGSLDAIPDDAGVVLVLGPQRALSTQQVDVLMRYMERGGALLIAHEPGTSHRSFEPLHERLLINFESTPLATTTRPVTLTNTRLDRYNILTRDIIDHPATSSFRDPRTQLSLLFPSTGYLEELAAPGGIRTTRVEPLVSSPSSSWADIDRDYDYDPETETRARRLLIAAARSTTPDQEDWRVVVMADSTALSDLVLARSPGNEALLLDHVAWLLEDTSSTDRLSDASQRTLAPLSGPDRHIAFAILATPTLLFLLLAWAIRRRRSHA